MSNKSNRKLPDVRFTFSPPPPSSHLTDRHEKYGPRYGSAGDISTGARGFWRYSRIYGDKVNLNRNNPVNPENNKTTDSFCDDQIDGQQVEHGNVASQNIGNLHEDNGHQVQGTVYMTDGCGSQDVEMSGPSTNKPEAEKGKSECLPNTRTFSNVVSPTEKKRKLSGTEQPEVPAVWREMPQVKEELEEDFFERLFETSLEFMSEEDADHETDTSDRETTIDDDDGSFEAMYQRNRQMIQSKSVTKKKSQDDDNTASGSYEQRFQEKLTSDNDNVAHEELAQDLKSGILHRQPSMTKRHSNVRFSNQVSVETFSDSETEADGTKTILAHGDGPPDNISRTSAPLQPPGTQPDFALASGSGVHSLHEFHHVEKPRKDYHEGKTVLEYVKGKILKKLGNESKPVTEVSRKDSLPKTFSPTELLRQRQKTYTDKIIKETCHIGNFRSDAQSTKTRNIYGILKGNTVKDKINAMENVIREQKLPVESNQLKHPEYMSENDNMAGKTMAKDDGSQVSSLLDKSTPHKDGTEKHENADASNGGCNKDLKQFKTDLNKIPSCERYSQDSYTPSKKRRVSFAEAKEGVNENKENENYFRKTSEPKQRENKNEVDRLHGLGTFTYKTPSKHFQKIEDRKNSDKNSQGHESDGFSTYSELFLRGQDLKDSWNKEQPGYWFFQKNSDNDDHDVNHEVKMDELCRTVFGDMTNKFVTENLSTHAKNADSEETMVKAGKSSKTDVEMIKKRKMKFLERCKRKMRMDQMEQWAVDHKSCTTMVKNTLSNSSVSEGDSNAITGSAIKDLETNIQSIRKNFENIACSTDMQDPATMHELLTDFLLMMERKLSKEAVITTAILKQLEFVYESLVHIARQLLEHVNEAEYKTEEAGLSSSTNNATCTKDYAIWLSFMLESSETFLYGSGPKADTRRKTKASQIRKQLSESANLSEDPINLQTVLCDLGVIKDSLTCLLTGDQTDFKSITDLKTIESRNDFKLVHSKQDIQDAAETFYTNESETWEKSSQPENNRQFVPDWNGYVSQEFDKRRQSIKERVRRKSLLDHMEHTILHQMSPADKIENILKNKQAFPDENNSVDHIRIVLLKNDKNGTDRTSYSDENAILEGRSQYENSRQVVQDGNGYVSQEFDKRRQSIKERVRRKSLLDHIEHTTLNQISPANKIENILKNKQAFSDGNDSVDHIRFVQLKKDIKDTDRTSYSDENVTVEGRSQYENSRQVVLDGNGYVSQEFDKRRQSIKERVRRKSLLDHMEQTTLHQISPVDKIENILKNKQAFPDENDTVDHIRFVPLKKDIKEADRTSYSDENAILEGRSQYENSRQVVLDGNGYLSQEFDKRRQSIKERVRRKSLLDHMEHTTLHQISPADKIENILKNKQAFSDGNDPVDNIRFVQLKKDIKDTDRTSYSDEIAILEGRSQYENSRQVVLDRNECVTQEFDKRRQSFKERVRRKSLLDHMEHKTLLQISPADKIENILKNKWAVQDEKEWESKELDKSRENVKERTEEKSILADIEDKILPPIFTVDKMENKGNVPEETGCVNQEHDVRQESIKERVERKNLMDHMEHKNLHQISGAERMENILKNRSSACSFTTPVSRPMDPEVYKCREEKVSSDEETKDKHFESMDPYIETYVYLSDFLEMMEKKNELSIGMSFDDCRELELIYDTLIMIADNLITQTKDSEIKSKSDEFFKEGTYLEPNDSTKSLIKGLKAQRYACWLIDKLGSTASLLLRQSATDSLYTDQETMLKYLESEQSVVSLQDIIIDLTTIQDSMTNLFDGNQPDFDAIIGDQGEDAEGIKEIPIEKPKKPRESSDISVASGYLADNDSKETVITQLDSKDSRQLCSYQKMKTVTDKVRTPVNGTRDKHLTVTQSNRRDSVLLPRYQKMKTVTGKVVDTVSCMENKQKTVTIFDSFVPEKPQRNKKLQSSNSEKIQMPQREWSPREHRHFTSTETSSIDDSSKLEQISQPSTSNTGSGERFYSPTGHMFGDVNYPSPSVSLSNDFSQSTLGTLQSSDWALMEQETVDYLGELRKEDLDSSDSQRQDSLISKVSPEYYPGIYKHAKSDSVPCQIVDQNTQRYGAQIVAEARSAVPRHVGPKSQSPHLGTSGFVSPEKPLFRKEEYLHESERSVPGGLKALYPDYQQDKDNRFSRRMSPDSGKDIKPEQDSPHGMVKTRIMSTPVKDSTDTFVIQEGTSQDKIQRAVREILESVPDSYITNEEHIPNKTMIKLVRKKLNSIKPKTYMIFEEDVPSQAGEILESVLTGTGSSRDRTDEYTRVRQPPSTNGSVDITPGTPDSRGSHGSRGRTLSRSSDEWDFPNKMMMYGQVVDSERSTPTRDSISKTSEKDTSDIPARFPVDMGLDAASFREYSSQKKSMPVRRTIDLSPHEGKTTGKKRFYTNAPGAKEVTGEKLSQCETDRSFSLPTRYAYYDDIKRQKHAFYELYGTEPGMAENLDMETGMREKGAIQKSSITFTQNPVYHETRVVDHTEWQSNESPDMYFMHLSDPTTKSESSSIMQESPKEIRLSTHVRFPDDTSSLNLDLGPSRLTLNKMGSPDLSQEHDKRTWPELPEGDSPERGQRLYGSTQALDRRGEGGTSKRKPAYSAGRSMTPDTRSFLMEREVSDSQNRKLQMEITTLQTENKLLKEKHNRATARISELETQLTDTQDDLNSLQETLNKEMSELSARTRSEIERDKVQMEKKIQGLTRENERLKAEVSSLEKQLGSSHRETDLARHNSEKNRTIEAHRAEIASLKEELNTVKALLEQSERHLRREEERHHEVGQQLLQLTELKNALQQQADSGGNALVSDKQLESLEKRLKVTEERLHQERADRANNLSSVEEKLLSENARLQASEKEFTRQLHREKDRNRNLDQRLKQVREENEKLRLAMPFDDSVLLSNKESYDIPYSSHSNQRVEAMKITDDMNYILSQIEKQDGLQSGQEEEMIRVLWNKRELAYKQLRDTEVHLKELRLDDNNIVDGLKNLRDTYGQAESKLKQMEEHVEDTRGQMTTLEATYKEQLNQLVKERHDAFARLKTIEDILEAVKTENLVLRQSLSGHQIATESRNASASGSSEALQVENASLHSKVSQLTRQNKLLESEISTIRVQLEARTKTIQDIQSELEQAYRQLKGSGGEDKKQEKIEILTAQLNSLQVDLNSATERYNLLLAEKINLEVELSNLKKSSEQQKIKQSKTETIETKALQELKDSLAEKDSRVTSLNIQLEEAENQLQKTRQDLYIEQEHAAELEAEVEILQQTVNQRAQMFEALSGTEREQYDQYQLLKETLDSVTQELSHKHAQIISLDVNLSGQKDRVAELERELQELKQQGTGEGDAERKEVRSGDRLRIHELEIERASLKQELTKGYSAIRDAEEQFRTLQTENKQLEQEAVKEKTIVLQITAEKGEIEQHLEELAEEHDSLIQEKNQAEEDLIKLENKLQEILQKYEGQARKQHNNFETKYGALTPEMRQMISELDSLRLLLDGKEKELDMLKDKLSRQLVEIDFLNRKVELVHNDSIANREDVARMISELTLKMKEAVSTREVNQFLAGERTRLQSEKNHMERELEQERKNSDQRKSEINEVIRKVETSELQQMSIRKEDKTKTAQIASLEAELRNARQNLMTTQTENTQLKNRLDHLQEDLKNLTAINATLEKRLEMEQNTLSEEKNSASKWKEDYNATVHELELLRHEQLVLGNKLAAEEHTVENLKKEVQTRDNEIASLQEEIRNLKLALDREKGQLLLTKDTIEKLTQDKGSIYQDYEGMCRSLTEKERQLNELRDRSEEKIESMKREHTSEKLRLEQDKSAAEKERDIVKQEMDRLNEELKQKEVQLSTFGKTLSDLETVTRKKNKLEGLLRQQECAAGDHKLLLEGQRKEVMSLSEALAKLQDENTRLQVTNQTLQMDQKSEQEKSSREIHDLKVMLEELKSQHENERTYLNNSLTQVMLDELKSQHENERTYLNNSLTQTQTQLRATQASLAAATEDRDSLKAQKRLTDNTVEELQSKSSEESTARRLMEKSLGSMRLEVEELRNEKNVSEARLAETKNQLSKMERQLKSEQEKSLKISARNQELVALSQNSDANVKAKDEQADLLHKEITKLRQMLDSQKQNLTSKMKKTHLEFKQQLDLAEEDKEKLSGQVQKLSSDLDLCREQIANKNKENLKLQEQIVTLEDRVSESQVKLKQAEDNLKMETENQSQMHFRYHEQDEELKRLRSFLAKKVEESGEADKSMWHEMNRVIQELSRQMTSHLDAKSGDNKSTDTQMLQRYKKQLADVQSELSTEKSLHQITKTSLQALEEDCKRLQQQLQKLRRREKSPSSDRKYKNRMEAINAIIARSQIQAQALLASGGYMDTNYNNPHGSALSPHRGFHSPARPDSPDNSYASDLSIASLPPMPFSKYSTSTRAAEAK